MTTNSIDRRWDEIAGLIDQARLLKAERLPRHVEERYQAEGNWSVGSGQAGMCAAGPATVEANPSGATVVPFELKRCRQQSKPVLHS